MQLDLATAEYIGAREQQQDLAAALPLASGALLVLADGLGGHESGAEASRIVVTTFKEAGAAGRFKQSATRRQALREVLDLANARIAEGVDPAHGHRGMASTVVAAIVDNRELRWVSVGDSHLYVWREGRLHKLNEDHSQAGLMVRSGQYKPSDPEVQAVKSVLVSALTGRKLEIVDLPQSGFRLEPGDVLMLASDGLNTLSDAEIEQIVAEVGDRGAVKLSTTLLESVRGRRLERQDNTTVVVARVLEPARVAAPAAPARRPESAAADTIDDTSEERTQRVTPPADQVVTSDVATKPVAQATPALVRGLHPSTDMDATQEASASATEPEATPTAEPRAKEPAKSPVLKPRSERPEPPRNMDRTEDRENESLASGRASADLSPDAASAPRQHTAPGSRFVRGLVILVLLLLAATGVAIAAFKPGWLSSVVPGFGESKTPPPETKAEPDPAPGAAPSPEQVKLPASTGTAPADATSPAPPPTTTPEASGGAAPADVSPSPSPPVTAPAASATEVSGKSEAAGASEAPTPQTTPPAATNPNPPLVEPERPALNPDGRGRSP